jgi:predicted ATP-binding protein involved in virulence
MTGNDMFFDQTDQNIKKAKKQISFTLPYLGTKVDWNNNNRTYIIGYNGTGKTLLLNEMMAWCESKGFEYIHYDSVYALSEAPILLDAASDDDLRYVSKILQNFTYDFQDDISGWAKAKNLDEEDPKLIRHVLDLCGGGYTRMTVMILKAINNPTADYYFMDLPETSIHLALADKLIDFLMSNFEYMKFVVATQSPEVVKDVWFEDGSRDKSDVIEMNFDHIEKENNRKFEEQFS